MLETALILPLFLVFWFGIVDWGIAYWAHQSIVFQANEAARWGVVHGYDATAIRNMVVYGKPAPTDSAKAQFGLKPGNVTVNLVCSTAATCPNTAAYDPTDNRRIVIRVAGYKFAHFTPFFAGNFTAREVVVSLPTEHLSNTI